MIPSLMILTGSLIILALAGYWMRRAVKAERRVDALQSDASATVEFYEREAAEAEAREQELFVDLCRALGKLCRIEDLETPNMAHVGKVAVAIAKGER